MEVVRRRIYCKEENPFWLTTKPEYIDVIEFKTRNKMTLSVMNYGCIINSWKMRGKDRNEYEMVATQDTPIDYFTNPSYVGALLGRTAGRVGGSRFHLDDGEYYLQNNHKNTTLHGGYYGFDKKLYRYLVDTHKSSASVMFYASSLDGEENYPGHLRMSVRFRIWDDNTVRIDYHGHCNRETVVNLTHNNFFNLSGNLTKDINIQELQIRSSRFLEIDEDKNVTGKIGLVDEQPSFDFRRPIPAGTHLDSEEEQLRFGKGYDHYFFFDPLGADEEWEQADRIRVFCPETGIRMRIATDAPGCQYYSQGSRLIDIPANGNKVKPYHCMCLNLQAPPIGVEDEFLEDSLMRKGKYFDRHVIYRFDVEK